MRAKRMLDANKTEAEIAKLMAETAKINAELRWLPVLWGAGFLTALAAIAKFL